MIYLEHTFIAVFLLIALVFLAVIGIAAITFVIYTIRDDRELAERKSNNKTSE